MRFIPSQVNFHLPGMGVLIDIGHGFLKDIKDMVPDNGWKDSLLPLKLCFKLKTGPLAKLIGNILDNIIQLWIVFGGQRDQHVPHLVVSIFGSIPQSLNFLSQVLGLSQIVFHGDLIQLKTQKSQAVTEAVMDITGNALLFGVYAVISGLYQVFELDPFEYG